MESSADRLRDICSRLRAVAKDVKARLSSSNDADLNELAVEAAMLFSELKGVNRKLYSSVESERTRVAKAKSETETRHLALQNLLYEKANLLREIKACREFATVETDKIELMDERAFEKTAPPELAAASTKSDPHKRLLNRLSHEHIVRKDLVEKVRALKEKREDVEKSNIEKKDFLVGLPDRLEEIEQATRPLQKYFGASLSDRVVRQERVQKLPAPLFVCYCQLESYGDSFGGVAVDVADSGEPPSRSSTPKKRKREDGDVDEEGDAAMSSVSSAVDTYAISGVKVLAKLEVKGGLSLSLKFTHLPNLEAVAVEVDGKSGLLANLFPDDTGQHIRHVTYPKQRRERPYKWVQWLGGIYKAESASSRPSTKLIVDKILQRALAQQSLNAQLEVLSQCPHPVPVSSDLVHLFPPSAVAKLEDWEEITPAQCDERVGAVQPPKQYLVPVISSAASSSSETWTKFGRRCFRGVFAAANIKVEALVQVFSDYPSRAPRFSLSIVDGDASTKHLKNDLRSVEVEVNAHAHEVNGLLEGCARRLQHCLDVVTNQVDPKLVSGRHRRGKLRALPLFFNHSMHMFTQR